MENDQDSESEQTKAKDDKKVERPIDVTIANENSKDLDANDGGKLVCLFMVPMYNIYTVPPTSSLLGNSKELPMRNPQNQDPTIQNTPETKWRRK